MLIWGPVWFATTFTRPDRAATHNNHLLSTTRPPLILFYRSQRMRVAASNWCRAAGPALVRGSLCAEPQASDRRKRRTEERLVNPFLSPNADTLCNTPETPEQTLRMILREHVYYPHLKSHPGGAFFLINRILLCCWWAPVGLWAKASISPLCAAKRGKRSRSPEGRSSTNPPARGFFTAENSISIGSDS
jgi:hypothetical protein